MNIIMAVVCAVLMILGVSELVRLVTFWWTRPLTEKGFTVVVSPESGEDCECVIRAAAERLNWLNMKGECRLVCLNRANDEEIERVCRYLMLYYPYLRVSKTENLVYYCMEKKN